VFTGIVAIKNVMSVFAPVHSDCEAMSSKWWMRGSLFLLF